MRRLWVLTAIGLLVACRPSGSTKSPGGRGQADAPTTNGADETPGAPSSHDGQTPSKPQCASGGEVWDGHHDGCRYEVGGCCYDNPAAACSAAACSNDDCRIMEVSPAQIVCEPPKATAQS